VIEQVQYASKVPWNNPNVTTSLECNIRYSHAVKVLFFAVQNTTLSNEWSNYTTRSPTRTNSGIQFPPENSVDPIGRVTLYYEGTARLNQLPTDYFSLVQPWYYAPVIPNVTGYHAYSYSLWFYDVNPKGSTEYGKLTGVTINFDASADLKLAAQGLDANGRLDERGAQTFTAVNDCINHNVVRIAGGALGFPTL
jgi:hypothetical protein